MRGAILGRIASVIALLASPYGSSIERTPRLSNIATNNRSLRSANSPNGGKRTGAAAAKRAARKRRNIIKHSREAS